MQNKYLIDNKKETYKNQATIGIAAILLTTIQHIHQSWLLPNHHKHKSFTYHYFGDTKLILIQELRKLYKQQDEIAYADKAIICFSNTDGEKYDDNITTH